MAPGVSSHRSTSVKVPVPMPADMKSTGARDGLPTPKQFLPQDSSHCSLVPPQARRERAPTVIYTGRFSSRDIYQSPPAAARRDPPFVDGPSPPPPPPPLEQHPALRRSRAKYTPIVITPNAINSVLRDLSEASDRRGYGLGAGPFAPLEALKQGRTSPPTSPQQQQQQQRRIRHKPIVIPEFALPYGLFPLTPADSDCSTPRASPLTADRPPTPPPTMSRPPTGGSAASNAEPRMSTSPPRQQHARYGSFTASQAELANVQATLRPDDTRNGFRQAEAMPRLTGEMAPPPAVASMTTTTTTVKPPGAATAHQAQNPPTHLSGLVCNVHRCTGKEPRALVGATTTILGDKLYVFGGRSLSRSRPQLTSNMYELDLVRRHWTRLRTTGNVPSPRYFHSMCALGDSKLVCYGGMSPVASSQGQPVDQQPEVAVMSDMHIYETKTRRWIHIPTQDTPLGRYAHCAAVLPSTAVFSSSNAPLSAIHHNPSSENPNQGSIGVALDGTGGAELIVVGGQDSGNHYIEEISVFNLRSLRWTQTDPLGRMCGAYRSVVTPLVGFPASQIGAGLGGGAGRNASEERNSMLMYSNYNFLDVKLELQVRSSDGSLTEKAMSTQFSPPGLRFPNGGVLDNHFVVSGTYLTSTKQEYALWALDLRTLGWSRIDAGGSVFGQGSWNRGVLWPQRNTFVILGDRRRSLVEDYNHRRINFSNVCLVELEAFGLYDNPRHTAPMSSYQSYSAPNLPPSLRPKASAWAGGGRPHFSAADELGQMAMGLRELADMDLLSISGEKIPANSHLLARRWGPYFVQLLREGASSASDPSRTDDYTTADADAVTLRPTLNTTRNSTITITPSISTAYTGSTAHTGSTSTTSTSTSTAPTALDSVRGDSVSSLAEARPFYPPNAGSIPPSTRSRILYLPHTSLTIQALLHFLYTSSLPPISHQLCTPQVLCSLLQLARPYRVDGLLEAVVERLHQVMDGRNAAAVFNACAMAAGGGRGTGFDRLGPVVMGGTDAGAARPARPVSAIRRPGAGTGMSVRPEDPAAADDDDESDASYATDDGEGSATDGSEALENDEEVWTAERSCVIGLQKRGLRGLMEGRRMRERGRSNAVGPGANGAGAGAGAGPGAGPTSTNTTGNGLVVGMGRESGLGIMS